MKQLCFAFLLTTATPVAQAQTASSTDANGQAGGLYDPVRMARAEAVLGCFDVTTSEQDAVACVGISVPDCEANTQDNATRHDSCWRGEADAWIALNMTYVWNEDNLAGVKRISVRDFQAWEAATIETCGPQTIEAGQMSVGTAKDAECWATEAAKSAYALARSLQE